MLAFEVPFTATAGNCGAFFWSHDIGGHNGSRNEESYARWCQFGAFSAALRSHSSHDPATDRRPWNYPAWAEASMKASFGLRARLMPYLYTAIHRGTADSVPFTRPIYIDHPAVEAAYHQSQEYTFGSDLLVAPVASPGVGPGRVAHQAVYFPPGDDWYDFYTGEAFGGGESAVASAPIDQMPLYVRGGVPLPMQPWTARPGTAPVDALIVRCYPGRDSVAGTAELYEDDGTTDGYRHGQSATTPLRYVRHGDEVTITVGPTAGTVAGRPDRRSLAVEFAGTQAGATAADGTVSYDPATFTTKVSLPAVGVDQRRTVTVHAPLAPPAQVTAAAVAGHLRQLLGEPLGRWRAAHPNADNEMAEHIAAVQGVAVLPVKQQAYGYGDATDLIYFHNHATAAAVLTVDGRPVTVKPGDAVVHSAPDPHGLNVRRTATLAGLPDGLTLHPTVPTVISPADDLARRATATVSSGSAAPAIDGSTDGYPGDQHHEWVTDGQKAGAWVQLTWPAPTRMTRVLLYDRPNGNDHIEDGRLTFDDGTTIDVPALPNDGHFPAEVTFPAKMTRWVKFTVLRVSDQTENIGLSEIGVSDDGR